MLLWEGMRAAILSGRSKELKFSDFVKNFQVSSNLELDQPGVYKSGFVDDTFWSNHDLGIKQTWSLLGNCKFPVKTSSLLGQRIQAQNSTVYYRLVFLCRAVKQTNLIRNDWNLITRATEF